MESKKPETGSKLQYRIDVILSVVFIAAIFFMGVMTVLDYPHGFKVAVFDREHVEGYLKDPEKHSPWDMFEATVLSLDDYIAGNCYKHTELGYVNSGIQYALGKRMISTGGQNMVKLNTGHLYDLQNYLPMEKAAADIAEMRDTAGDIPFLFVYEHPTVYSDEMMPEGYDVLDHAPEIADEATSKIRAAGIEVLDTRDLLPSTFPELTPYLYVTDQHWTTRAAISVAQKITEWMRARTDIPFDPARLDIENFDATKYEKLFLGKYGQRVGTGLVDPDDVVTFAPKYDTKIHRYTNYYGQETDITGTFDEAVLKHSYLEPDEGKTWNKKAYFDYGLTEKYEFFDNENGADGTVLLLKDSYSAPVGAFLSLACKRVVSVDLRHNDGTLQEWIDFAKPDAIVVAYSMQMLRDDKYEFQ